MVRFQRLTGARPAEVCALHPKDVDRSANPWAYRPASHKTQHHGRDRVIFVGPKAQAVLLPYLLRDAEQYCFSPQESERRRHQEQRARRKSKVPPSQLARRRSGSRKRAPKDHYDVAAYGRAIRRACLKHQLTIWRPNQLRHAAGTAIRARFGIEAAQTVLGHSRADVTQIYAERDLAKAAAVMRELG